jgi:hypothetical protein
MTLAFVVQVAASLLLAVPLFLIAAVIRSIIETFWVVDAVLHDAFVTNKIGWNLRLCFILLAAVSIPCCFAPMLVFSLVAGAATALSLPLSLTCGGSHARATCGDPWHLLGMLYDFATMSIARKVDRSHLPLAVARLSMRDDQLLDVPLLILLAYIAIALVSTAVNVVLVAVVCTMQLLWYIPAMLGFFCRDMCSCCCPRPRKDQEDVVGRKSAHNANQIEMCIVTDTSDCCCSALIAFCWVPFVLPLTLAWHIVFRTLLLTPFVAIGRGISRYNPERCTYDGLAACFSYSANTLPRIQRGLFQPMRCHSGDPWCNGDDCICGLPASSTGKLMPAPLADCTSCLPPRILPQGSVNKVSTSTLSGDGTGGSEVSTSTLIALSVGSGASAPLQQEMLAISVSAGTSEGEAKRSVVAFDNIVAHERDSAVEKVVWHDGSDLGHGEQQMHVAPRG